MAITHRRPNPDFIVLPTTTIGRVAVGLLGVSITLVVARLVLTPTFGLPVSYLVIFIPTIAAGLTAAVAMSAPRERSMFVLATVAFGLLAASWLLAETLGGVPSTNLDESANGQTVTVASGSDLIVSLPGNPTTGYGWEVTVANPEIVSRSQPVAYMPSATLIGSGGTYTFQYRATKQGSTDLAFVYRRPWETGTAPLKTYRITVIVR